MTPLPPTFTEETKREFREYFGKDSEIVKFLLLKYGTYIHHEPLLEQIESFLLSRTQAAYDLGRAETLKEVSDEIKRICNTSKTERGVVQAIRNLLAHLTK